MEDRVLEVGIEQDFTAIQVQEFLGSLEGKTKEVAISLYSGFTKSEIARMRGIAPASVTYYVKRIAEAYKEYCIA